MINRIRFSSEVSVSALILSSNTYGTFKKIDKTLANGSSELYQSVEKTKQRSSKEARVNATSSRCLEFNLFRLSFLNA